MSVRTGDACVSVCASVSVSSHAACMKICMSFNCACMCVAVFCCQHVSAHWAHVCESVLARGGFFSAWKSFIHVSLCACVCLCMCVCVLHACCSFHVWVDVWLSCLYLWTLYCLFTFSFLFPLYLSDPLFHPPSALPDSTKYLRLFTFSFSRPPRSAFFSRTVCECICVWRRAFKNAYIL